MYLIEWAIDTMFYFRSVIVWLDSWFIHLDINLNPVFTAEVAVVACLMF